MKRIEVKLSLAAVAPLLDVAKLAADSLQNSLAAPPRLDELDPEFRAAWQAELIAAQGTEVAALLALFDREFFSTGVVAFDEANAEIIMRACSALRLRLRAQFLGDVPDDQLESGDVRLAGLTDPVRRAFMCYIFLATIQELILHHLDSVVLGETEAEPEAEAGEEEGI